GRAAPGARQPLRHRRPPGRRRHRDPRAGAPGPRDPRRDRGGRARRAAAALQPAAANPLGARAPRRDPARDRVDRRVRLMLRRAFGALGLTLLAIALPAPARAADANVSAAVAGLNALHLAPLTGMPSGRTTYRTIDDYDNELRALATAHPNLVAFHTA